MRGCLVTLLVVILLVAGGAVGAYWYLTQPSATAAQITPVPVSSAAAVSFDQKFATVQAAKAPVTVEITEQEATSKLVATINADPTLPKIENPQVTFRNGKTIVSGTSRDTPIPVTIVVTGRIEARDGKLVATVEQIDTGRFPLPGAIQQQITDLAQNTERLNEGLPITVTQVQTLDGKLVLTGQPK